ncbi:hypothetical protein [Microbulbifer sp.]
MFWRLARDGEAGAGSNALGRAMDGDTEFLARTYRLQAGSYNALVG